MCNTVMKPCVHPNACHSPPLVDCLHPSLLLAAESPKKKHKILI